MQLSKTTIDNVIKHVEDEVCELMKMNVTVIDSTDDYEVFDISDVEDSLLVVKASPKNNTN